MGCSCPLSKYFSFGSVIVEGAKTILANSMILNARKDIIHADYKVLVDESEQLCSGSGQATTALTTTYTSNSALVIQSSALAVLAVRQQYICYDPAPHAPPPPPPSSSSSLNESLLDKPPRKGIWPDHLLEARKLYGSLEVCCFDGWLLNVPATC